MSNLSEDDLKEFTQLISLDLENGDVEKVVSLFQYNKNLYQILGRLLAGGNMFVRLGVNMLLEDLKELKPDDMKYAFPHLIPLLSNENATIRGDVADIIGNIGDKSHIELLTPLLNDEHPQVQEMAEEAIETLEEENLEDKSSQ